MTNLLAILSSLGSQGPLTFCTLCFVLKGMETIRSHFWGKRKSAVDFNRAEGGTPGPIHQKRKPGVYSDLT